MEVEVVGHHRGPQDPGCEKQFPPMDQGAGLGDESLANGRPRRLQQQELHGKATANEGHHGDHHRFQAADAPPLQQEQQQGVKGR